MSSSPFDQDPKFEQGRERARIFYDEGLPTCIDVWLSATMAVMGQMPDDNPALVKGTMHNAIEKIPDTMIGKRP
jgi:hypothetical protein